MKPGAIPNSSNPITQPWSSTKSLHACWTSILREYREEICHSTSAAAETVFIIISP